MEMGETGMKGRSRLGFLAIVLTLFFFLVPGEAQEKKGAKTGEEKPAREGSGLGFNPSRAPIDITSDTVEGNQKLNTVTFKGNVVAKQDEATIYANTVTVYYDPETKRLKEIVAVGNVRLVQLDRRASGQKMTFNQDENKIILDGDAVIREGDNVIRGERMTYFIDEQRSVVEAGKGARVSTTIVPTKKQ